MKDDRRRYSYVLLYKEGDYDSEVLGVFTTRKAADMQLSRISFEQKKVYNCKFIDENMSPAQMFKTLYCISPNVAYKTFTYWIERVEINKLIM